MIPPDRVEVLEMGLTVLQEFSRRADARGRFIAMYLGFRLLGADLAQIGSHDYTTAIDLQQFLDHMWTKTHRSEPVVVLTAPFGGSTSPTAPYSTRTGARAPGNSYATNTWRNNFNIQKGIGCPADPETIKTLLQSPTVRLSCPHMQVDPERRYVCGLAGTAYRGEEHSIWLRMDPAGYQAVDLDLPKVYEGYLLPNGQRIPIFALIAVLYAMAPTGVYPTRQRVGIPDFAADFHFTLEQVNHLFDCDPDSVENTVVLAVVQGSPMPTAPPPVQGDGVAVLTFHDMPAGALPELGPIAELNTGVGAELAVAADLQRQHWDVGYRGNQRGLGYDLEAVRSGQTLRVEVKSSIGFTVPDLSESEWAAAQRYGDEYILAVVDFYGSDRQAIWYVRDPAASAIPVEMTTRIFRFIRSDILGVGTEAEFL